MKVLNQEFLLRYLLPWDGENCALVEICSLRMISVIVVVTVVIVVIVVVEEVVRVPGIVTVSLFWYRPPFRGSAIPEVRHSGGQG